MFYAGATVWVRAPIRFSGRRLWAPGIGAELHRFPMVAHRSLLAMALLFAGSLRAQPPAAQGVAGESNRFRRGCCPAVSGALLHQSPDPIGSLQQGPSEILTGHAGWFTERFGETRQEFHLFPFGKPTPTDPTRPTTTMKTAWATIRGRAGVACRLHDLRHTATTKMAEAGVPESTMLSLMGHMRRAMLERYSHIRMAAKRDAVEALSARPKSETSERVSTISTTLVQTAPIQ